MSDCPFQTETQTKKTRKPRSPPKKTGFNNIGTWHYSEKLAYQIFIFHHLDKFMAPELRRSLRLFNMMTKFIGTRTANQCRTQHHKYLKECGSIQKIVQKSSYFRNFKETYEQRKEQLEQLDLLSFFGVQQMVQTKKEPILEKKDTVSEAPVKVEENYSSAKQTKKNPTKNLSEIHPQLKATFTDIPIKQEQPQDYLCLNPSFPYNIGFYYFQWMSQVQLRNQAN